MRTRVAFAFVIRVLYIRKYVARLRRKLQHVIDLALKRREFVSKKRIDYIEKGRIRDKDHVHMLVIAMLLELLFHVKHEQRTAC